MSGGFLAYEDCVVNINSVTVGGEVIKVEPLTGKATGLAFTIAYKKKWPNGSTQTIPLRCYVTGAERLERLTWLKPGEWALVHGEVTDRGAIYGHQVEWLSRVPREPGEVVPRAAPCPGLAA